MSSVLTIFLTILKWIGILLLALVGILLLLIILLLLCPIRYDVKGACDNSIDSIKGKVKVTWLFHLVRGDVWVKKGKVRWKLRAAFLTFGNAPKGNLEQKIQQTNESSSISVPSEDVVIGNKPNGGCEQQRDESEKNNETVEKVEKNDSTAEKNIVLEKDQEPDRLSDEKEPQIQQFDTKSANAPEKKRKAGKEKKKLSYHLKALRVKIEAGIDKKIQLEGFLTETSHIHAFEVVKKEALWLFRKMTPERLKIAFVFGFEDPSITGKVLSYVSALYPLMGADLDLTPVFDHKTYAGDVQLKGKIYLWHIAKTALHLLLTKDVRSSYSDIKNFQL